jgi:hypothetical protein
MAIVSGFVEQEYTSAGRKFIIFTGSATQTYTLIDAAHNPGLVVTFKLQGTGVVTINTVNSQTIDGAATTSLGAQFVTKSVLSDGRNWNIVA